ncbi:hypothetical protein MMC12_008463 [Toensbergia leucococca]|nr:hypothetical protein [Toensbergia leucococca]
MTVTRALKRRKLTPPDSVDEESSPSTLVDAPAVDDFFSSASRWNLEQDYEQRPRKQKQKEKENTRLPIKTAEGKVEPLPVVDIREEDRNSYQESEDGHEPKVEEPADVVEEVPKVSNRQQIIEAKEELARLASLINEDPEEHSGSFRKLAQIAMSSNLTVKKLALATQLAVYKDVIPGYRIRPMAEADMTEKVSKDVRRLRAFEQSLVNSYQAYIKELAKYAKGIRGEVPLDASSLPAVAVSCACALLLAVPHFNFRGELLKILIDKLSTRKLDSNGLKCLETLETLFRSDEDGTPSLDAVTLLTRMLKSRSYRIDATVLRTLLHLRLLSEFTSKASQTHIDKPTTPKQKPSQKREFRTKKQRKILKERKAVAKEFKEADATVSHEERDRMQAETLKLVFVTYFRVLKSRAPHLIGAVLEGLAKYAHLINQDFFVDLLEVLKDLLAHTDTLLPNSPSDGEDTDNDNDNTNEINTNPTHHSDATRTALLITNTAFTLLSGQDALTAARTLPLDLSLFTTHVYKSLLPLSLSPHLETHPHPQTTTPKTPPKTPPTTTQPSHPTSNPLPQTPTTLLLHTLTHLLTRRQTPPLRLAAFTKTLLTASLQLPEKSARALLALLAQVTKIHGRKIAGLWNTEERKGDGVFDALGGGGGVEGVNAFAATVWEGELLRWHFCPGVREGVGGVERGVGV